ncbi:hypothetical protein BGZ81_002417 [Podila clonocystis]|nr:hypothetical protein BGZ81_002417 [Podila clonocystis]
MVYTTILQPAPRYHTPNTTSNISHKITRSSYPPSRTLDNLNTVATKRMSSSRIPDKDTNIPNSLVHNTKPSSLPVLRKHASYTQPSTQTAKENAEVSTMANITRSMARAKISTGLTGVRGGGVAGSQSKRPPVRKATAVLGDLTNIKTQVPERAQTRLLKPLVTLPVPVVAPSTQPSKSAQPQIPRRREGSQTLTRASSMSSMPVSSSHLHLKGPHHTQVGHAPLTASSSTSRLASSSVIPTPGTIRKATTALSSLSLSNKANLRNRTVQAQSVGIKKVVSHRPHDTQSSSSVAPSAPMAPKVPAGARHRAPRVIHPSGSESVLRQSSTKTSAMPRHSTNSSQSYNSLRKRVKVSRPIIPAVPLFDEMESGVSSSLDTEMSGVSPRASFELPIPDTVDEYDRDPAMVAEYQADIIQHMRLKELQFMPDAQYMDHQPDLIWEFRTQLIQWLVIVHDRFDLLQETLHLCINLLDRFLSATMIPVTQLQLAGIVALSLASKFEETQAPSLAYLAEMAADAYSVSQIKAAEIGMLKVLNYDLGAPGPMTFLRRISRVDRFDVDIRTLTKYLVDVTLFDERFLQMPASKIAAVGYCASMRLLNRGGWTLDHVVAAGYTESALISGVNIVLTLLEDPEKTHPSIWEKYQEERCMCASTYVQSLGVTHLRALQY